MRFATFQGEKSIAELAARLFRIQGRGSQAATKQAADTLLKANPQLKDLSKVAAGSLIRVPETAPPIAPGEQATSLAFVRSSLAQNIQAAFDAMDQHLSDVETSALARLKQGTERFQAAEVKTARKSAARATFVFLGEPPSLDSLAKDTKDVLKNVQAAQDARKQARTQLQSALASFTK